VPSSSPASAELRLAFGNTAEDYERGRPGWPDAVAEVGGLPPESEVLDLGAGTGKLTRVLGRRFARVTAVEPDPSMRALCSQVTLCCKVLEGSAEAIPLPDDSVDGVFCAEAFHWFDWPVAIAEIARVLRPRGALVLCFNTGMGQNYLPLPPAARSVVDRYRRPGVEPGGTILAAGAWRAPLDALSSPFEALKEQSFEHVHVQDRNTLVARTLSTSIFAALPESERCELGSELRAAIPEGGYTTPLRAEVYWARLR
jgi:SAM-dependent methyltransferase